MDVKIDVQFPPDQRPRSVTLTGPPGITFTDSKDGKVIMLADAKVLAKAILEIAADGGAEWARRALPQVTR